jgi:hypothetical protein
MEVVEGFDRARRVLNLLARRHLYPSRERWFPSAEQLPRRTGWSDYRSPVETIQMKDADPARR